MSDERTLLEAWKAGDTKAGDKLLRQFFSTLHRFFINKVPEQVVPDLIQETMLGCTQSIANFRQEAKFKTYLLGIARNCAYHYYRRHGRKEGKLDPSADLAIELIDEARVSSILARRTEQEMILRALRRIPVKEQVALELVYWEGLTAAECAQVLETSTPKFKHLLRKAKESFAASIQDGPGTSSEKRSISQQMDSWIAGLHRRVHYTRPSP